jgi:hypothetical protein
MGKSISAVSGSSSSYRRSRKPSAIDRSREREKDSVEDSLGRNWLLL